MLVDDDQDLLWLLRRVLVKQGLDVQSFSSAPSVDMVKEIHPAVLFMDVEIVQNLRSNTKIFVVHCNTWCFDDICMILFLF